MEFQYHGGNCISLSVKQSRVVVDDNLKELGLKSITKKEDIALFTALPEVEPEAKLIISNPGEYEVSEISIFGIATRSHLDEEGKQTATMYKLQYGDIRIGITGHIHPDVSEDHLEELGAIDILFIPVGGNGYTLDPVGAQTVIKKIEPKIIIPTHYEDTSISYPVPQQPISELLKALSIEPRETVSKFKPKPVDFSETMQLIMLERS